MGIKAELAEQIKQELVALGSSDNEALNTVAEKLGLDEDQILSYMFGDINEDIPKWGDDVPDTFVEPSLRVDHSVGVVTSENYEDYVNSQAEDESEEDDNNGITNPQPVNQPMTGRPYQPNVQSNVTSSGDTLEDIMAEMAQMGTPEVPVLEFDEEGDIIAPENPTLYVFAPWDNGIGAQGFTIFLKYFWEEKGYVDDRNVQPDFLYSSGFECVNESSSWENHSTSHSSAIKILRDLGLTEIRLP